MDFIAHIVTFFFIYALAAIGLSYCIHAAGIINLGHSAFFGIGAYTAALLAIYFDFNFLLAALFGGIAASLASFFLSLCAIRLKEDHLAVASLAFLEVVRQVLYNWSSLTSGAYGLGNIPAARIFNYELSKPNGYLILSGVFFIFGVAVLKYLQSLPLGLMILAAKNNPPALEMLGRRPNLLRTGALCLAAFFAGVAGAEYSFYVNYIHPNDFGISQSVMFLAVSMLSNERRVISGCVLGLVFYFVLSELLRIFDGFGLYKANIIQLMTAMTIFVVVLYRGKRLLEIGKE